MMTPERVGLTISWPGQNRRLYASDVEHATHGCLLAGLAACGQNDEAFKASYRNQLMGACAQGPARADAQQICTCMVDRYLRDTPTDRLRAEKSQTEMPPAARQAMMQCATEAIRAGTIQPAAPAPAP